MAEKQCIDCAQHFEESAENFRKLKRKGGGFSPRCRACSKAKDKRTAVVSREKTLDDIEKSAASTFLKAARTGGANIPHTSELVEYLMEYFGGPAGLSALILKQFFDSPAGGSTRTKIIECMTRLVSKNTELGGAKKPLDLWTDEEIEKELNTRLLRIAGMKQGRIVDGTLAPQTTADFAAAFNIPLGDAREAGTPCDAGGVDDPPVGCVEPLPAEPEPRAGASVSGE